MTFIWVHDGVLSEVKRLERAKKPDISEIQAAQPSSKITENLPVTTLDKPHVNHNEKKRAYYDEQREEPPTITIKSIMSEKLITLQPEATIQVAWAAIEKYHYRHIPVVDAQQKIVGILSDRDLLRRTSVLAAKAQAVNIDNSPVSEIMQKKVLVATPETSIREAAITLFREHVGCLPIINASHQLQGLITRSDLLRIIINNMPINAWL